MNRKILLLKVVELDLMAKFKNRREKFIIRNYFEDLLNGKKTDRKVKDMGEKEI